MTIELGGDSGVRRDTRVDILGVGVDRLTLPLALATMARWIERRTRTYVCITGVHGVMECQHDPELAQVHDQAGMVTADGMPLVWLSRLKGATEARRVYGPDLMLHAFERSEASGWRHYLYGSSPETLRRLEARLSERFPRASIVGRLSPPYRPLTEVEERAIVAEINTARPDIVWVGLSTPKQERWMASQRAVLEAPVLVGVGAAFDFHAGVKRQAPRWIQRAGLEWLFRLACEPRRLACRYLRNNPRFVAALLAQAWGAAPGRNSSRSG